MKNLEVDFQNEIAEVSEGISKSNIKGYLELLTNNQSLS